MPSSNFHENVYIEETDEAGIRNLYKICNINNKISLKLTRESKRNWQSVSSFFMDVFLPYGYPNSVSKDYLQYQMWDSIQAFASSITGSLCTHAVLKGAGVGDENASALAATITWLIKDGTSMIGKITFAWLQGTKLDSDCKKWRLFADVMNDLAMFLDLISANFQNHFTIIVCLSGLLKSIVGVAGGSTRAALTLHQARRNNMADVSAKDGSQETLVNLIALLCSLALIPVVTTSFVLTWLMYVSMTVIHLAANYCAVCSVIMETFNTARFKIYTSQYFCQGGTFKNLLSIQEVNNRESVFFSLFPQHTLIKLGCPFQDITGRSYKEFENIFLLYKGSDYILYCDVRKKVTIKVILSRRATALTELEAMYQACYLEHILHNGTSHANEDNIMCYVTASRDYSKKTFTNFIQRTKDNGFSLDAVYFNCDKWRVDW